MLKYCIFLYVCSSSAATNRDQAVRVSEETTKTARQELRTEYVLAADNGGRT